MFVDLVECCNISSIVPVSLATASALVDVKCSFNIFLRSSLDQFGFALLKKEAISSAF